MDNFLESLSDVASPALQQTIAAERDRLPPPEDFVGMTMEEARGMVVGYDVYLPAVRQRGVGKGQCARADLGG
ncbi:MAG: hypothetical protein ACOCXI_06765 [Chloroflexota bacterium]